MAEEKLGLSYRRPRGMTESGLNEGTFLLQNGNINDMGLTNNTVGFR